MDLSKIENIIFDLGGVIINLDVALTVKALGKLGMGDNHQIRSNEELFDLFKEYEKGLISTGDFIGRVKKMAPGATSDQQVIDAWNAMLLDLPMERVELLLKLKKKYRTFLLSNTNETHYTCFTGIFDKLETGYQFSDLFEKDYYSHFMQKRKPDDNIFQQVLQEQKMDPAKTLFIDDMEQNIFAAKRNGIIAYHLKPPETILDLFGSI